MSVITFTTDIGDNDFVIGALKGLLLQKIAHARFVDISLSINRQNILQAGYISGTAMHFYPANSFHIILVDPFISKKFSTILAYFKNQYIICPNNGLLNIICKNEPPTWVIELPTFNNFSNFTLQFGAQCTYAILNVLHNKPPSVIGQAVTNLTTITPIVPYVGPNFIETQILHIDKFENVIVNITQTQFEDVIGSKKFTIAMRNVREITKISNHVGEVPHGEPVAIFNMAGFLEIALNQGNAAGLFGLRTYNDASLKNNANNTRINFQKVRIMYQVENAINHINIKELVR